MLAPARLRAEIRVDGEGVARRGELAKVSRDNQAPGSEKTARRSVTGLCRVYHRRWGAADHEK